MKSCEMQRYIIYGIFLIFFFYGCASFRAEDYFADRDHHYGRWYGPIQDEQLQTREEVDPTDLMKEGIENFQKERYEEAYKAFRKISDLFPYSKFLQEATLKMGDSLYMSEKYLEAFFTYQEFETQYPNDPNIPYVIYKKGMCFFRDLDSFDKDHRRIQIAQGEFERLFRQFPKSEYAREALNRIRECEIYFARYELYVGNFYYKKKKYRAAMMRYQTVIDKYRDLPQYYTAREYLKKCKVLLNLAEEKNGMGQEVPEIYRISNISDDLAVDSDKMAKFRDVKIVAKKATAHEEGKTEEMAELIGNLELYDPYEPLQEPDGVAEGKNIVPTVGFENKVKEEIPVDQNKSHGPVNEQSRYPYVIQVCSFRDKARAINVAKSLRKGGAVTYTSFISIQGKGEWYRVFIGFYKTVQEAEKAVSKLKNRQIRNPIVYKKPYSVQVVPAGSNQDLSKLKEYLEAIGYLAYSFPEQEDNDKVRLLIEAFRKKDEAERFTKNLREEGLITKVVQR